MSVLLFLGRGDIPVASRSPVGRLCETPRRFIEPPYKKAAEDTDKNVCATLSSPVGRPPEADETPRRFAEPPYKEGMGRPCRRVRGMGVGASVSLGMKKGNSHGHAIATAHGPGALNGRADHPPPPLERLSERLFSVIQRHRSGLNQSQTLIKNVTNRPGSRYSEA